MTLHEARLVILDDSESFYNWVHAASAISSCKESTLDDLIMCLKRRGLPAEMAATSLYLRTKRPEADSVENMSVDFADWINYAKGMRPQ
jgi:hypothetical protein